MKTIPFNKSLKEEIPGKKIIVIGSTGMLGKEIVKNLDKKHNIITPTTEECDLANWTSVEKFFYRLLPISSGQERSPMRV